MSITLIAETGRTAGSRPSGRLREDGRIPAVVYGLGRDAQSVTVPWSDLRRALSTEAGVNALISLEVDGRTDLAIVKDLQRHPVRRNVLHVDFLRVDPDAPVAVDVPVALTGVASAVEGRRGIVDQPLKTLTVKAKPSDIPSGLELAIDSLEIGGSLTVADIALPAGVTTDVDGATQVVLGLATRFSIESEAAADADAAGDDAEASAEPEASAADEAGDEAAGD